MPFAPVPALPMWRGCCMVSPRLYREIKSVSGKHRLCRFEGYSEARIMRLRTWSGNRGKANRDGDFVRINIPVHRCSVWT